MLDVRTLCHALLALGLTGCGSAYLSKGDDALAAGRFAAAIDLYKKAAPDETREVIDQRFLAVARKELEPSFVRAKALLEAGAPAHALPLLAKLLQPSQYNRKLPVPPEGLFPEVRGMYADALIETLGPAGRTPAAAPDLLVHVLFAETKRFRGDRFPLDLLEPVIEPAIDAALESGDAESAHSLLKFFLSKKSRLVGVDAEQAAGHAKRAAALWSTYPGLAMAHAEMAAAGGAVVPKVKLAKLAHVDSTVPAMQVTKVSGAQPCASALRQEVGSRASSGPAGKVDVEIEIGACKESTERHTETIYVPRSKRVRVSSSHYDAVAKPPRYQETCDQVFYCRSGAMKERYWGALKSCNASDVYFTYECRDIPVSQGVEWVKRTQTSEKVVTQRVAETRPYTLRTWTISGSVVVNAPTGTLRRAFTGRASADTRKPSSTTALRKRALEHAVQSLKGAYQFVVAPTMRWNEGKERLAAGDPVSAADVYMRAWVNNDLVLYREHLTVIAEQLGVHVAQLATVLVATPERHSSPRAGWWRQGYGSRRAHADIQWEHRSKRKKPRKKDILWSERKQRLGQILRDERPRVEQAGLSR